MTSNRSNPALFAELPFIRTIFVTPPSLVRALTYLGGWLFRARRYDLTIDYDQYYCISELIAGMSACSAGFRTSLKGTTFSLSVEYDPLLNEKAMFRKLTERVFATYGVSIPDYRAELPELIERFVPSAQLQTLRARLKAQGKPIVGIYPGSGANATFRRWGVGNYVALIERYKDRYAFVLLGGPDERDLQADLKDIDGVFNLIDSMSLKEVAWFLKHTIDLLVGNDGGLLHVAESQAVATVGIFGPALYRKWGGVAGAFDRRREGTAVPAVSEELSRHRAVGVLSRHHRMPERDLDRRRRAGDASRRPSDSRRADRACLSVCSSCSIASAAWPAPGCGASPGNRRSRAGGARARSSAGARFASASARRSATRAGSRPSSATVGNRSGRASRSATTYICRTRCTSARFRRSKSGTAACAGARDTIAYTPTARARVNVAPQ